MLIEINLLPQKEPKKFNILYLSAIVALIILISGVYFWQIQTVKNDVASVDAQISSTKKITETVEKNASQNQASNSVGLLKTAVEWANDYPIQTIPVMQHLTALLPARGFIQSFAYTEAGTVTLSIQFDNAREAAYLLENLKDSDWIEDVSLTSLAASATEESANTAATQPAGQTTSIDTTGQTNTTTSTTTTTTNSTNTGVVSNGTTTTEPVNNNIVPRYVGKFEIKFNKDAIKKSKSDSKKTGEGVTAS